MALIAEFRARARHVLGPAIGICIVSYFVYHVIHGDRGLIAWRSLGQRVTTAEVELNQIRAERNLLEHRVGLLRPESLDPDMLDEWSRRILNFGHRDETVIFEESAGTR
jgi:cell division protein FtsB